MSCGKCSSENTKVIESRVCLNGSRRRRVWCRDCGYRWTVWDGERPQPGRVRHARGGNGGNKPPLSEDDVRLILTSRLTAVEIGRQVGRSPQAITAIRRGLIHKNTAPEIPRWRVAGGMLCTDCQHWCGNHCGMGFPDPIEEGPGFAEDCSLYQE